MNENNITISLEAFEELIRTQERVAVMERLGDRIRLFTVDEIKAILGIKREGEVK